MNLENIEGEEGLFEVRKIKILYEIIPLECGYLNKIISKRKYEIIERKYEKNGRKSKNRNTSRR